MSEDANNHVCRHCKKECPTYMSACSWECLVDEARANGAVEYLPNGLPIRCISHQSGIPMLVECEHGDETDYICPVTVEHVGKLDDGYWLDFEACMGRPPTREDEVREMQKQRHALIFTDGTVAVTMYECNYAMWSVSTGKPITYLWQRSPVSDTWQLSAESIAIIKEKAAARSKDLSDIIATRRKKKSRPAAPPLSPNPKPLRLQDARSAKRGIK